MRAENNVVPLHGKPAKDDRPTAPFMHMDVPSYTRTTNGLEVPCDGGLLMLDDENRPRCSKCDGLVRITDD